MKATTGTFVARYAMISDLEDIKIAYGRMLMFLDDQEFDILPTTDNVNWIGDHIFEPAIIDGRSEMLIVENEEGQKVAYLFWITDPEVVQSRFRKATSYGQWVDPEFRGNSLVPKMVGIGADNLRRNGIERVLDMVHTDDISQAIKDSGFKVDNKIVILEV